MTDKPRLSDRLEALTAPSRDLDYEIQIFLFGWRRGETPPDFEGKHGGEPIWLPPDLPADFQYPPKGAIGEFFFASNAPRYTASTDAAFALLGQKFPGWTWSLSQNPGERAEGWVAHPTENSLRRRNSGSGAGCTPATALVAAIVALHELRAEEPA